MGWSNEEGVYPFRMREHNRGAKGQLITEWDGIESHVIVETERRILSSLAEGDSQ